MSCAVCKKSLKMVDGKPLPKYRQESVLGEWKLCSVCQMGGGGRDFLGKDGLCVGCRGKQTETVGTGFAGFDVEEA